MEELNWMLWHLCLTLLVLVFMHYCEYISKVTERCMVKQGFHLLLELSQLTVYWTWLLKPQCVSEVLMNITVKFTETISTFVNALYQCKINITINFNNPVSTSVNILFQIHLDCREVAATDGSLCLPWWDLQILVSVCKYFGAHFKFGLRNNYIFTFNRD